MPQHVFLALACFLLPCALHAESKIDVGGDPLAGRLTFLGWDTEGGDRASVNLLRPNEKIEIRVKENEAWRHAKASEYSLRCGPVESGFDITVDVAPAFRGKFTSVSFTFPFEPRHSAVTIYPARVDADETFHFPAVVAAPGSGAMRVTPDSGEAEAMTLLGSRAERRIDWTCLLALEPGKTSATLRFRPVHLLPPKGLKDEKRWAAVRRAWLNTFQVSARWGDRTKPGSAPAGALANNVISDPVSSVLYFYADLALFVPDAAEGVSFMKLVGHSLDWWVDSRMLPSGEIPGYWDYNNFTDTNPSILISAWDYVESTGDRKWLADRIAKLEKVAAFTVSRDMDHDGLIEAVQSGDAYTLKVPARSCSAHDAVNCGHKDAYSNILSYRAFRCMADLEKQLGRTDEQARFTKLADELRTAFRQTLINPKTGWVMFWKSRDGQVHDPAAPWVNFLAIQYGIVDKEQARDIMTRLRAKMDARGFKRFDLGIPCNLDPIPRGDYLQGAPGCPKTEDGADTLGEYLNGGVIMSDGYRYPIACHMVGMEDEGDRALDAMIARSAKGDLDHGGFPVNIVDSYPKGGEFFTWNGYPCGYEGLLSSAWYWVGAVVMREPQMRERMLRPMLAN
jgi:hypothetical protein